MENNNIIETFPKKGKPMSKDEVSLLVDLIQANPTITSKQTNAATNKLKEEVWGTLTCSYNSRNGLFPRSKEQLRAKWDNLKKTARKRAQTIRMNYLKTGGGKPEYMPPDDILDRVCGMMGSTCTGLEVPFGGDGVGNVDTIDEASIIVLTSVEAEAVVPEEQIIPTVIAKKKKNEIKKLVTHKRLRGKENDDSRQQLNLLLIEYYKKKIEKIELEKQMLRKSIKEKYKPKSNNILYFPW